VPSKYTQEISPSAFMWHLWPLDDGFQRLKLNNVFFWGQNNFTNFDNGIGKALDLKKISGVNKVD
jgi:hypothetical protein